MRTRAESEIVERAPIRLSLGDHLAWWVATGGGSGLAPIAPGTVGAFLGVLFFVGTLFVERAFEAKGVGWIVVSIFLGVGVWASSRAGRRFERTDPPQIVIDEIVGQYLALAIVFGSGAAWPRWSAIGVSFVCFRLFDIWKPYPIRRVERWPSGIGIMADDVLAGGYAGLATHAILLLARQLS
ncbi:MAG: phosphatidylglycerophosphatase A [Blastocatellia bacterium]|nr:phosphatidylglycerophosphatase A [Blastocatellia bacterium]MCS7157893.1 phosphatidylglycerophosphatase A [Blastocatellia bacterium]MCX7753370.1 phosphatidylglycerophosphatase A [Blastocatellia bacterium]MDW8168029.1 phosphatidylglycerophosphatase A [Acidobacteriota bacterium]MDW8255769.1 phosphatidylglycerophosphatase A [Acidobacteriota bacterium]